MSDKILEICGTVTANISLRKIPGVIFTLTFFVLKNSSQTDIILGRDFLTKGKLTLVYGPSAQGQDNNITELFACLPFSPEEQSCTLKQITNNLVTDFDFEIEKQLESIISEIKNKEIIPIDDDYSVEVRLKDDTVYAYAPRRFAHSERLAMR